MILACRGFKVESCKSAFIVVSQKKTSRVGCFFSASIIEDLKNLLKAFFSILFKLAFVVTSSGCERCVMFFGTITDSISCFDRTSDKLAVEWALKASHIRILFWSFGKSFSSLKFLIYGKTTCSIRRTVSFSLLQWFSLYDKQTWGN